MNRRELQKRLREITAELLREKRCIAVVDVLMQLGYLDPKDYEAWRMRRVPFLEKVIKVNLSKISFIIRTVRRICRNGELKESWTGYKSWGKGKKVSLRFSKSGEDTIERAYATHFLRSQHPVQHEIEAAPVGPVSGCCAGQPERP